jgi:hypothetical protein
MIPCDCERESEIVAATRLGQMSPELQTHARECPVCSELLSVAAWLKEASALSAPEYDALPTSDFLWQKARERGKQTSVTKALRPIRWMTAFAVLTIACLPVLGPFSPSVRHVLGQSIATWSGFLDTTPFVQSATLSAFDGPAVLLGCSSMLLFLALSSWYVLKAE